MATRETHINRIPLALILFAAAVTNHITESVTISGLKDQIINGEYEVIWDILILQIPFEDNIVLYGADTEMYLIAKIETSDKCLRLSKSSLAKPELRSFLEAFEYIIRNSRKYFQVFMVVEKRPCDKGKGLDVAITDEELSDSPPATIASRRPKASGNKVSNELEDELDEELPALEEMFREDRKPTFNDFELINDVGDCSGAKFYRTSPMDQLVTGNVHIRNSVGTPLSMAITTRRKALRLSAIKWLRSTGFMKSLTTEWVLVGLKLGLFNVLVSSILPTTRVPIRFFSPH